MKNILEKRYIKKNITKEWLSQNNFRYNRFLSENYEENIYSHRFPIYKYAGHTILECEISVKQNTGEININVYDNGTYVIYPPFYYKEEYKNYSKFVDELNQKIIAKLKELGITEKGEI